VLSVRKWLFRTEATASGRGLRPVWEAATSRAGVVAVLVVSLCANGYLFHAARGYHKRATALRLDPGELRVYAAQRGRVEQSSVDHPLLVFLGDSRALMWSQPTTPTGYRFVNRGIGYQTTAQILLRFDEDVAPLRPNVVVVEAGVNDLKAIAEFPERRAEIVADCEANLERIVSLCRNAGATVVLVTVFAIGDIPLWMRPFWSKDVAAAVHEVNAFLPKLAGDRVTLFDANQVLIDARGDVRRPYQLDHLHLSAVGYAALNQRLVSLLPTLPR
jgi:lysophospholipase L1-like esterase